MCHEEAASHSKVKLGSSRLAESRITKNDGEVHVKSRIWKIYFTLTGKIIKEIEILSFFQFIADGRNMLLREKVNQTVSYLQVMLDGMFHEGKPKTD